eukprot:CAMPEP_0202914760 /NCGR_PEP_ID=MMETSP1392-20130828/63890_1 /ASSEMBLY_ACC=CAM_ASM_000868 /TAXON_ID=225041 /ORGANISM="Chlamydomonas chlamydogama, Strain SAG 11-48b" /LENGTH=42 /DNA_ID= /DNA_START= /DNA_END= /DNA_ORIENTATION=
MRLFHAETISGPNKKRKTPGNPVPSKSVLPVAAAHQIPSDPI